MTTKNSIRLVVVVLSLQAHTVAFAQTDNNTHHGVVPQIFAPGQISTHLPEFATSFSPDGKTVYFNRTSADRQTIQIWSSEFRAGAWSQARPLPFSDGQSMDVDPFVSHDGKRLYFSSKRPLKGDEKGDEPKDFDIWYVERTGDGWGSPVNLGAPVNSVRDEIYSTMANNGNLYFSVYDESDGVEIYRSAFKNGIFQAPERINIGTGERRLTNPTVAPGEEYLLLVADQDGQADIFVSWRKANGSYSDAVVLGPTVNSGFTEFAPHISTDGNTLFFTSERPGMLPQGALEGRPPGDLYSIPISAELLKNAAATGHH